MNYVQEGLYIGTVDDAYNVDALQKNGVTHILTVVHQPLRKEVTDLFCYKFIHALDMESQDLLSHFEDAITFIDEGRAAGGVLVHWWVICIDHDNNLGAHVWVLSKSLIKVKPLCAESYWRNINMCFASFYIIHWHWNGTYFDYCPT